MNRELKLEWQRGSTLVTFLNKEGKAKQKTRKNPRRAEWAETLYTVAELLETLQKLKSLLRKKPPHVDNPVWWEWELARERLETSINRMLWDYRFRPVLSAYSSLEVRWLMANKPRVSPKQLKTWHETDGSMSTIPIDRTAAIQIALEMATAGTLERVRRCRCGLWFLAAPSLKKAVCSDACRFEKYQSKKGYKKNRRDYMRDYMRKSRVKARRKLLACTREQKKAH
jgi:hypothetical protein